jgi:outer membrane protein assembly factor BamB
MKTVNLTLLVLAVASLVCATDYPCWRGPDGTGCANTGLKLVDKAEAAKLAWVSEDPIPAAGWDITAKATSGGLNNPVVADGRVYLTYYEMSGDVVADNWQAEWANAGRWKKLYPTEEAMRQRWTVGADDVIHCFDAATGKTLWKKVFKDQAINYNHRGPGLKTGPHMTPCVADGKLYATGALMALYCLDAKNGDVVWQNPMPDRCKKIREDALAAKKVVDMKHAFCNVHLQYVDGILVVPTGDTTLTGYDAKTGKQVWNLPKVSGGTGEGPVRWANGGRTYLLQGRACVDPAVGKVLWTAEGDMDPYAVPAVAGDVMVSAAKAGGLDAFRITPTEAKKLWSSDLDGNAVVNGASPAIHGGHAYVHAATDRGKPHYLFCLDLQTGQATSRAAVTNPVFNPVYDSLTGGDGLLFKVVNRVPYGVGVFVADPKDTRYVGRIDEKSYYGWCSTGAYADGRLYFRRWDRLVCYDLRAPE